MQQVEKRQQRKITEVRQDEHERQMANWFADISGINGGDCQD